MMNNFLDWLVDRETPIPLLLTILPLVVLAISLVVYYISWMLPTWEGIRAISVAVISLISVIIYYIISTRKSDD